MCVPPSKSVIILSRVVHWFPNWQHQCCRVSRELCSNYLSVLSLSAIRQLRVVTVKRSQLNCFRLQIEHSSDDSLALFSIAGNRQSTHDDDADTSLDV